MYLDLTLPTFSGEYKENPYRVYRRSNMKSILLAMLLLASTSAYALHELDNPDLQGNPITEENQPGAVPGGNLQKGEGDAFGSITENPPQAEEDPGMWKRIQSWWFDAEDE